MRKQHAQGVNLKTDRFKQTVIAIALSTLLCNQLAYGQAVPPPVAVIVDPSVAAANAAISPDCVKLKQNADANTNLRVQQLDPLFDRLSRMKPSQMSCLDKFMNVTFSSFDLFSMLGNLVNGLIAGLINGLLTAACKAVDQTWNDSMKSLTDVTSFKTAIPNPFGNPITVNGSLVSQGGGGATITPNVSTNNAIVNNAVAKTGGPSGPAPTSVSGAISAASTSLASAAASFSKTFGR